MKEGIDKGMHTIWRNCFQIKKKRKEKMGYPCFRRLWFTVHVQNNPHIISHACYFGMLISHPKKYIILKRSELDYMSV
jgi:hypothetical protein